MILLIATSAWGQTETVVREPDRVVVRQRTALDFDEVEIEVGITRPAASYIPVRRPGIFKNLIKIRGTFVPELQRSVDRL